MDTQRLEDILRQVQQGKLSIEDAMGSLRTLPYEDLEFAKVDHHRELRTGFPEVVYAPGKTHEQLAEIARRLAEASSRVLITRAAPDAFEAVRQAVPEARYNETARAIIAGPEPTEPPRPGILVVAAGTSDLPVAEEAAVTAEVMGNGVERLWDVGVAGVHRLLERLPLLHKARVVVAVAGMEGALPSLVGGLVSAPVIAVPTSVGYGASFQGLAALLAMLNACSPGIAVVNIDNGFGAGYMAGTINLAAHGVSGEANGPG
ncbi:MAG: nickel pincer cofactor biosynthesis protein LarB [Chloroflexota bacterium]|nr:nickel pincer cofactor biosynthesis protein LarB [Chloroflexota bacterium]MDE3268093.1 nickel pincer cofactor biosynthesis protein LarB [Chloroflexota bacterium]